MNISTSANHWVKVFRRFLPDGLGVLIVALVSWNFTFALEQVLDIALYDESVYLWRGAELATNGFPDAVNAPLYAVWYYILGLFQPDRAELYYLNYKVLNLLPALLFYVFCRTHRVNMLVALLGACLVVTCRGNLQTWPKVSHCAICIILSGLILASCFRRAPLVFGCLGLVSFAVSYTRPEYFPVSIALVVMSVFADRQTRHKRDYVMLAAVLTVAGFSLAMLGLPVDQGTGRSFVAFRQHFSLIWVAWKGSSLNPWTDSGQIIDDCFGDAGSALQCFRANPVLVLKHILYNLAGLPGAVLNLFLYPSRHWAEGVRYSKQLSCHLLALLAFIVIAVRRSSVCRLWASWHCCSCLVIGGSIMLIPPLVSSLFVYPRDHYLLLLVVPFIGLLLVLARDDGVQPNRQQLFASIGIGAFFILATPDMAASPARFPIRSTISFLGALKPSEDVHLLEAEGGFHFYLNSQWHRVAEYGKRQAFFTFKRRTGINAILLSDRLANDSRFRADNEWLEFLRDPELHGFESTEIPGSNFRLIHKEGLFPDHRESDRSEYGDQRQHD